MTAAFPSARYVPSPETRRALESLGTPQVCSSSSNPFSARDTFIRKTPLNCFCGPTFYFPSAPRARASREALARDKNAKGCYGIQTSGYCVLLC